MNTHRITEHPTHVTRRLSLASATAAVAALYALSLAITRSSVWAADPDVMAVGVTLDLTATATLAVYLLAVRPGHLPRIALVAVFFAGLLAAQALVPPAHRDLASAMLAGWAVVELTLAAWLACKARRAIHVYRTARATGAAGIDALRTALTDALGLPAIAGALAHELAVIYYATAGWLRRPPAHATPDRDLTMWRALLAGLLIVLAGEALATHMLLRTWSPTITWIAAALHLYTALWLLGDYRALRLSRGLTLTETELVVEHGLRARTRIPRTHIARIELLPDDATPPPCTRATVMGTPNVIVHTTEPIELHLLLGRTRTTTALGLAVEDPSVVGAS